MRDHAGLPLPPPRARAVRVGLLAFSASCVLVAAGLAPAVALALAGLLGPREVAMAVTSHENVREAFGGSSRSWRPRPRSVSVIALVLGREVRGIEKLRKHHDQNAEHRRRVREAASRGAVPLGLAPFLAVPFEAVEEPRAPRARP